MVFQSVYTKKIEQVAKALKSLKDNVYFIGGAAVSLYINDPAVQEIRQTKDIDCIIEVTTRTEYYTLEEKLQELGFRHYTKKDAPICRWIYKSTIVDIMPTEPSILGFSNPWYPEGIENAIKITLSGGTTISAFTLHHFIASKIEAFKSRGNNDFRTSYDIEDIITVLDGQANLDILFNGPTNVISFLKDYFRKLIKSGNFEEALLCHLEPGPTRNARAQRIMDFLAVFIKQQNK